ncbi:MAG: DeoR/GlpR family DNA-binding transcription regulator [Herpetosiphon sp.]
MNQEPSVAGFGSAAERRKSLLSLLAERKQISVAEASNALGVSEVTVRTDFAALEKEGLLQRVWGGATLPGQGRMEGSFATRLQMQDAEKQAIAAAAVEMVRDGETLLLDASTTAFAVAKLLKDRKRDLTIITNGLHAALELSSTSNFTVIVVGGVVRSRTGSIVGPFGEHVLASLHTAKGFFSARGLSIRQGLSEATVQEGQSKALMVEHAEQVIAILDSTKLGRTSLTSFCAIDRIDQVITAGKDAELLAAPFIARGMQIQVEDVGGRPTHHGQLEQSARSARQRRQGVRDPQL